MTADKLHEALNLLPGDLIAETDALRCRPIKTWAHGHRWAAIAACLAVVLFAGAVFGISTLRTGKSDSVVMTMQAQETCAAAEAPVAADRDSLEAASGADTGRTHAPTEEMAQRDAVNGDYGNTAVTVYIGGEAHTIWGSDAIALTDILENLPYDPEKICNCITEYTVDTESAQSYEINLTERCVRSADGQADLTEAQAQTIREIVERLKGEP